VKRDQLYCCGAEPRCDSLGFLPVNQDSDSELIAAACNCRLAFVGALEYNWSRSAECLIRFTDPRELDNQ
jgi:hypothetical protein